MSESLGDRALRIAKALDSEYPREEIDLDDVRALLAEYRRLMAEQGAPVVFMGKHGGVRDVEEMTDAELSGEVGDWEPLYRHPASPPSDALEAFLKECEAEAAHIEKNGSALRTKFGDEHEGRCRELCATYLREFISSYRIGQRISAIDAAMKGKSHE